VVRALFHITAFIGLLISLSVVYLGFFIEQPPDRYRHRYIVCGIQVQRLAQAVEAYKNDCSIYPNSLQSLITNEGIKGWRGPYVTRQPIDPWGRPFQYLRSSDSAVPEIMSYGADGKPVGDLLDSDISSRDPMRVIPATPFEIRALWIILGIWLSGWAGSAGCIGVLIRTSWRKRAVTLES
jgi:general secretion pathway protein G